METALCLNCLLELHPALHTRLPMLEDYLFDGHAVYENVDNDGAIVTFENELGVLSVIFETDYKTTTWTDPGGGPNSAGAPRRSQTSTTVSLDSAGRVEIIAPREQRTNITTTHWKTYLNP
jgi:hypothetical protein